MDVDAVLSAFAFVKGRPLQVTMKNPSGLAWATDMPCGVPADPAKNFPDGLPDEHNGLPVVRIGPKGDGGYYTDFPVEKIGQDHKGNLTLTGPKGTATFKVGGL